MKTVISLVLCLVILTGCGGTTKPTTQPVVNAAGVWPAQLSSGDGKHTSTLTLNISQGSTSTTDSSGVQSVTATAAAVIHSPDCLAVTSGKSTTGSVHGNLFNTTLTLSDGGTLTLQAGVSPTATSFHFFDGIYTFTSGTCAPQSGTLTGTKQ